jgi:CrcB protein
LPVDRHVILAVFAGGFVGALLRTGLAEAAAAERGSWPWTTFAVNVVGAFLLGLVVTRLTPERRPLLGAGFCGALTTFSTLQLEVLWMLDAGRGALALLYMAASVAAGWAAVALAGVR